LCGTEGDEHEGNETESLTVESLLEIIWDLDRVTREETLVQDDESEDDWLRLDDLFSFVTEWSEKRRQLLHLS